MASKPPATNSSSKCSHESEAGNWFGLFSIMPDCNLPHEGCAVIMSDILLELPFHNVDDCSLNDFLVMN